MTPHFAIVVENVDEDAGTYSRRIVNTTFTLAYADHLAEILYPWADGVGIEPLTDKGRAILAAERVRPDPLDLDDCIPW